MRGACAARAGAGLGMCTRWAKSPTFVELGSGWRMCASGVWGCRASFAHWFLWAGQGLHLPDLVSDVMWATALLPSSRAGATSSPSACMPSQTSRRASSKATWTWPCLQARQGVKGEVLTYPSLCGSRGQETASRKVSEPRPCLQARRSGK